MREMLRSWGLLAVALVLGVVTFVLANIYLTNKEQSLRDSILSGVSQKVAVVVATTDVRSGEQINSQNMAVAEINSEHVSASAVSPNQFSEFEGQVLKYDMSRGEPLLSHAVDGRFIERFSELIELGNRAVTVEVDSLSSNSGLLVIGDFVDIVVSGEFKTSASGENKDAYVPLFQKVKVLAIDRQPLLSKEQDFRYDLGGPEGSNNNNRTYDTVTLAIDDDEANLLAFASEVGDIKFFLRNSEDDGREVPDIVTKDSFDIALDGDSDIGAYLYMSAESKNQVVRPLLTVSDAIVNQSLRVSANQKSVPIGKQNGLSKAVSPMINIDKGGVEGSANAALGEIKSKESETSQQPTNEAVE